MKNRTVFYLVILLIVLLLSGCGRNPIETPTESPSSTETATAIPIPTSIAAATPLPTPSFVVGEVPFQFVGSFVPAWYFESGSDWSEEANDDLIQSARKNGITVFHIMLPIIEPKLGIYDEVELRKLDLFLDTASNNNVYVMISFIHAYGISLPWAKDNDPYYSPNGIDGLINNEKLAQALKNRIKFLIERKNSINGKIYSDDPTIMSWIICDEPISPDFNYAPGQAPKVTVAQLRDWLDSTATYIKSLDPNHLVTVWAAGGINSIKGGNWGDWIEAVDIPSIDFIYADDVDMRILQKGWPNSDWGYSAEFFNHNKPVVIQVGFPSGAWDLNNICGDYNWQAQTLDHAFRQYYDEGVSGMILFNWGSDLYLSNFDIPRIDSCMFYTDTNIPIGQILPGIINLYDPSGLPGSPMPFVKIQPIYRTVPATNTVIPTTSPETTWTSKGLERIGILALAIDPTTSTILYAGQMGKTGNGVYKSTNSGENWSEINNGLTNPDIRTLAIDPVTPTTLYAGTNNGVFKSTDGGGNWSAVNTGLTYTQILSLAIDPEMPTTLYAGTYGGVFKSTDGGGNWSAVNTGLTANWVDTLAIDPAKPSTLYAGTYSGVFKSTNGGGSWSAVNSGLTAVWVYALAIDPTTPTTLYAGTYDGVFKSTDGGESWGAINTGLTNFDVQALAIDPTTPTTLYAGTFGDVFKSTDGGGSWSAVNNSLANTKVFALAIDPATPITLYAGTYNGVFADH